MHTGIWIDQKEALIYLMKDENESVERVRSNIDPGHVKGGARAKVPYGPQDVVSESKYLEKRKHSLKEYFDNIASKIDGSKMIFVLGPAQTKQQLHDYFKEDYHFKDIPVYVKTEDKLTENQIKAKIRDFFTSRLEPYH